MSPTFQDGDFSQALPWGPKRFSRPFVGDFVSSVFEQDYAQKIVNFKALPPDTAAAFPYNTFYLVAESEIQATGVAGVGKWTRKYAQIPLSRIDCESYSYTFPGLTTTSLYPVHAVSSSSSGAGGTTFNLATSASEVSPGDPVKISYVATDQFGTQYGRQVVVTVISGSGSTFTTQLIIDPTSVQPLVFSSFQKVNQGRDPYTREVPSVMQYDYFLPGVSAGVKSYSDITTQVPTVIVDNTGKQTNTYSATTSPTQADYLSLIAAKANVVAVESIIKRWQGSIFERMTRYVRAQ